MTDLQVRGLVAGFGSAPPVLDGLDLDVASGALVAVLGASGCGKTTLLRVLAGFHRADAGEVLLGGRPVSGTGVHVPPERRRVGVVPQEGALFGHLDVAGNVAFGLPRAARRTGARVAELLELVGLPGAGRRAPGQLSGGQQQRVALARALAPGPDLVLLDEPFSALDAALRAQVRADVVAVLRSAGTTAVLVTHDQEEALGTSDVVAVLHDGRVAQQGPPQRVYAEPVDLRVGRTVGDAVVLAATGRGDGSADTPLGPVAARGVRPGRTGRVLLRPEQLTLDAPAGPAHDGGAPGTVRSVVFHGRDTTLVVALAPSPRSAEVTVRVPGVAPARPGDPVLVRVRGPVSFFAD